MVSQFTIATVSVEMANVLTVREPVVESLVVGIPRMSVLYIVRRIGHLVAWLRKRYQVSVGPCLTVQNLGLTMETIS